MANRVKVRDRATAEVVRRGRTESGLKIRGDWEFTCVSKSTGKVKWVERVTNLVVNTGLDHMLDATLSAGSQITDWFIGLIDDSPTIDPGDTMSSHAGWSEVTAYDEATRPQWSDGGVSNQTVSNSGTPAEFTISANGTGIGGAFLASNSTKGGTTGTLFSATAFTGGDKTLGDDDVLRVVVSYSIAVAS